MTKKVIAITVPDVLSSFAITRLRPNLRFPCPNLPSIAFLILSSSDACLFFDLLTFAGGLPKGGPLILIPFSLHHARFSLYGKSDLHERTLDNIL